MSYQRGKIYTIRSHQTDKVYVGSTVNSLNTRMAEHRSHLKKYTKGTSNFVSSFTILDYKDVYIELYENYPCNSKEELHRREGEIIQELGEICVNKVISGRTGKEYYEDNKEKIKEKKKEYREKNKDEIKKKQKEYYEDNKEKIKEYRENNKDKIKEYYEKNKDKINEREKKYREANKDKIKEYRENNKDKIKERRSEKVECECGSVIRKNELSRHRKTQKHKNHFSLTQSCFGVHTA